MSLRHRMFTVLCSGLIPPVITFLDTFKSSTKAAFSTSKLFSTSTLALQIRRSSDNTTMDIGFVSNVFDTATATAFIGGGTGYVSKWYDQTGNGYDYIQATTTNQPQITLNAKNGLPALTFDGATSYMQSGSFLDSTFDHSATLLTLAQANISGFLVHESGVPAVNYYMAKNGDEVVQGNITLAGSSYQENALGAEVAVFNYNGTNMSWFINSTKYATAPSTAPMSLTGGLYLGSYNGGALWWNGDIYTKIYMNAALSDSDTKIVSNKIGFDYGMLTISQLTFDGNSLTEGINSTTDGPAYPGTSYPAQLMTLTGGYGTKYTYLNQGEGGATTEELLSLYVNPTTPPNLINTNGFCSKLLDFFWEGRNSFFAGDDATTAYNALVTYVSFYKAIGYKIAVITCEPSWMVGGPGAGTNVNGVSNAAYETQRLAYNAMIIAGVGTNYDYVIDLSVDPRIGDPANLGDTTYWDGSGVHMTDAGYGIVASLCVSTLNTMLV